jgi:hypothetical protein
MSFTVIQLIAKLDLFEHCLKNVLQFNAKKMEGQVKVLSYIIVSVIQLYCSGRHRQIE